MSNKNQDFPKFDGSFLKNFINDAVIYAKSIDPLFSVATSDDKSCQICNTKIEAGSTMRNMRCEHLFHEGCIVKQYDSVAEECPICHQDTLIQIEFPDEE